MGCGDRPVLVLAAAAAAAAVAACGGAAPPAAAVDNQPARRVCDEGGPPLELPLVYARFDDAGVVREAVRGAEIAAERARERLCPAGVTVTPIAAGDDDGLDGALAGTSAPAAIVVGTDATVAAVAAGARGGTLLIATSPLAPVPGRVVTVAQDDAVVARAMLDIAHNLSPRVGVIADEAPRWGALRAAVIGERDRRDPTIPVHGVREASGLAMPVGALHRAGVDVVVILADGDLLSNLLGRIKRTMGAPIHVGVPSWGDERWTQRVEVAVGFFVAPMSLEDPAARPLAEAYRDAHGRDPSLHAARGHDAVLVAVAALAAAADADPGSAARALGAIDVELAAGRWTAGANETVAILQVGRDRHAFLERITAPRAR